ncbi:MAG: hypothetical protein AAF266_11890, partial [Planctomycetota bacterium]
MATPLTAMNKYTGVMMAVLCALLMFAFVIGDPLMQYAGGGGGGSSARADDLVASWKGGRMNERQLDQAVVHRNILAEFQQQVYIAGTRDAQEDGVEDLSLRVQPIDLPRSREQGVETSVVRTKIFAQRAREAGMVVSDAMVVDYLRALGRDRVSNDQMRDLLARMNVGGRRATIAFVFDLLREAMLANNYLASHTYVFRTILPEERWEDWKKLNERVVVEAAPLRIEDFIDEVPEPEDAELETFFDEHKNREPTVEVLRGYGNVELPSAQPAFAIPPRVRVSYLKADFNAMATAIEEEITEEEIAEFYENNKESFIEADRALFGDADSLFGDSDEITATDEATTDDAEPSDNETAEQEAEPEASDESAADESAVEEEAEESVNPLRNQDEPSASVEEEEEEEEAAEEAADSSDADETAYQPLDEVRDEIRRRLAITRAAERIQEKMDRVKSKLDDEFVDYFDTVLEAEGEDGEGEVPEAPESLTNLKPLAEAEELELVELDLAPQMELRDTEVGGSVNADVSAAQVLPTWFIAFRPQELDLYQPLVTRDIDGNRYIVLVTKRYEGEVPELDDVREQVVAAWKRVEAAKLALAKAEDLAEEASESGQSLTDFFADREDAPVDTDAIEETDAFSFLSTGPIAPSARQVPLRLSQPQPLVAPGPELLEGVFELEAGKVGAELNHDHSIAYLLRIAQKIGTEDELRREFLRDGNRYLGGASLTQARAQNKLLALIGNLLDESG